MAKKQALGRGLSALLPDHPQFEQEQDQERILQIAVSRIHPDPEQPRRSFDEEKLAELADSIRELGVMQPLLLAKTPDGDYRIVAGERRYRAAVSAGLQKLPCIVRHYSPEQLAEASLIENIQREDLSALEEAAAYRRLMDGFGYTQEQLAQKLGKSRSYLANTLRLLQLPGQYRAMVEDGRLSPGHARAVLSLSDPLAQSRLVDAIIARSLSVRDAEKMARDLADDKKQKPAADGGSRMRDAHFCDLEKRFRGSLGMPVKLSGSLDKGKLVISYNSGDDLENLMEKLLEDE